MARMVFIDFYSFLPNVMMVIMEKYFNSTVIRPQNLSPNITVFVLEGIWQL